MSGVRSFLSTPSMRRATLDGRAAAVFHLISIHALREEGDRVPLSTTPTFNDFYPRPPRGGRRQVIRPVGVYFAISIHALREEGDPPVSATQTGQGRISIHALREEGDASSGLWEPYPSEFLSTPSARRATGRRWRHICSMYISIHALLEEGDDRAL